MAKKVIQAYKKSKNKKRPGVHSKNASRSQTKFKKKYKGQGR
tara:strand:- start:1311 stop:1436 length:126 start_codon:yes stop_codon:yes gene_type:complete